MRNIFIASSIAGLALFFFAIGLTNGYSGCVAVASENLTNRMLRGQ